MEGTRDGADPDRWVRRLSRFAFFFAGAVLALRFLYIATKSLTYDEATYVELAAHPWRSSYYPDAIFARHPPLYFLFMTGWTAVVGDAEWALRLPSLMFCLGSLCLLWAAVQVREGATASALAGLLVGSSFLYLVYGLQTTMYPLAALFASLGAYAHLRGRSGLERWAIAGLAITHLFGFVFIALRLWRGRERRQDATAFSLPIFWLIASTIAVLAVRNEPGPELGPAWQAARVFAIFYDLFLDHEAGLRHAFSFLLMLLMLNPVLLRDAWDSTSNRNPWRVGLFLLVVFLFTGPSFMRFGIVLLPVALALGLAVPRRSGHARDLAVPLVVALAALVSATAFVNSGLDAGVQNDVPGLMDWRGAADLAAATNASLVAVPAPPPMAYYLTQDHGAQVVDRSEAPDKIRMLGTRSIEVRLATDGHSFAEQGRQGALLFVPETNQGALAHLFRDGYEVCARLTGLFVLWTDASCARS